MIATIYLLFRGQDTRLLLEAWQRFEKEEIGDYRNLTVQELAEKFLARQKAQGRSTRTIIDDRSRLNAMTKVLGHLRAGAIKRADILRYMEGIAPGTNRRSQHKTLRKLWRWAHDLGHVANDPMAKVKPLDAPGSAFGLWSAHVPWRVTAPQTGAGHVRTTARLYNALVETSNHKRKYLI
ncbi:MAG: hypothetical protein JO331_11500 [Verrucomicrobia bacterium]|nr:hypothetical protein [Verrucomicrobiota bacterium]